MEAKHSGLDQPCMAELMDSLGVAFVFPYFSVWVSCKSRIQQDLPGVVWPHF